MNGKRALLDASASTPSLWLLLPAGLDVRWSGVALGLAGRRSPSRQRRCLRGEWCTGLGGAGGPLPRPSRVSVPCASALRNQESGVNVFAYLFRCSQEGKRVRSLDKPLNNRIRLRAEADRALARDQVDESDDGRGTRAYLPLPKPSAAWADSRLARGALSGFARSRARPG